MGGRPREHLASGVCRSRAGLKPAPTTRKRDPLSTNGLSLWISTAIRHVLNRVRPCHATDRGSCRRGFETRPYGQNPCLIAFALTSWIVLRNGRTTQRTSRKRCLPKQGGFKTRPYHAKERPSEHKRTFAMDQHGHSSCSESSETVPCNGSGFM